MPEQKPVRQGWFRRHLRSLRRKTQAQSELQTLIDIVAQISTGIQVVVPVYWAFKRSKQPGTDLWQIYAYLGFVLYSLIHRYYLSKRKPKRLLLEEERRPMRLAGAISKLAVAIETGTVTDKTLAEIERQALEAVTSEVEAKIGDMVGGYLNASLIVPDLSDDTKLKCINRSNTHRAFPKSYQKHGMLAWKAISEGKIQHEPEYHSKEGEPYRSILCFPLAYTPEEGQDKRSLGCVTIDHSKPFEFADLEKRLEIVLSPYLRILELVLIYRSQLVYKPTKSRQGR